MNPLTIIKAIPYAAILVLSVSLFLVSGRYFAKCEELSKFRGEVAALGEQAQELADKLKAEGESNLKKVKEDHEAQIPDIRAGAVRVYLERVRRSRVCRSSSGGRDLSGNSPGLQVDDGTSKECVVADQFVADSAEDAAKIEAWRQYCQLNLCPVKE